MVVAGPGTGKTELLSMRVANILRQTDTDPSNILCLTFTESAAANMVERLARIIGQAAYQVNINTFHGFGSAIIGRYGEYFYHGADYAAASPLTQTQLLCDLLRQLPFDSPLASIKDDQPVYLSAMQSLIQDFKKSGLTPDQLRQVLHQNLDFCQQASPLFDEVFGDRVSKKMVAPAVSLLTDLAALGEQIATESPVTTEPSLAQVVVGALGSALTEVDELDKASPLSQFKKAWLQYDNDKRLILKDQVRSQKLLVAVDVYEQYLAEMDRRGLYDFADMILQVTNAMRQHNDLKYNLQEQYQYILVDEFQDTNDAQMALLAELTDYDDQPNLMVVGDDDQAIYRFQGADISNIQRFAQRFPRISQINLETNYRSSADILQLSSQVATGISERLTNVDGSPKRIIASEFNAPECNINRMVASTAEHECAWVAAEIQRLVEAGARPSDIAVLARHHASLEKLSYYLAHLGLPMSYERQRDVFQSPLIQLLLHIAGAIDSMHDGSFQLPEAHLPFIIADPAFGYSADDFYRISLAAQTGRQGWLQAVEHYSDRGARLMDWLKRLAQVADSKSLNAMLATIMGIDRVDQISADNPDEAAITVATGDNSETAFHSPVFAYYFDSRALQENALRYLNFLSDYNTLTAALKDYQPDNELKLADLLNFARQSQILRQPLFATDSYGGQDGVQLMTAHKAKGMEFPTVFIIDAESEQWGGKSGNRGDKLALPTNMPFGISGDSDDEKRRLFFVALTRAKQNLYITAHSQNNGKALNPLEYIMDLLPAQELPAPDTLVTVEQLVTPILQPVLDPAVDRRRLLASRLENYALSATDLNAFVDLEHNGPEGFLQNNLLRVPSGVSAPMLFGTAVHAVMEWLHNYVRTHQTPGQLPPMEQALQIFRAKFQTTDLDSAEAQRYTAKGQHAIELLYQNCAAEFQVNQRPELKLTATLPSGVRLTGKIDVADIDAAEHTIRVLDYKTGKAFDSFDHPGSANAAKAHRYWQQLMFYKLLIEHSSDYHGWRVTSGALEFVEPVEDKIIRTGIDDFAPAEMASFTALVEAVWQRIMTLDLPDTSQFKPTAKGILEFEQWLIDSAER